MMISPRVAAREEAHETGGRQAVVVGATRHRPSGKWKKNNTEIRANE
jgi:hypothetical protein